MFTRNWYKAFGYAFRYGASNEETYKNTSNVNQYLNIPNQISLFNLGYNYDGYCFPSLHKVRTDLNGFAGVIFGTGTTAPTLDDYFLSGEMITTLIATSDVKNVHNDNGVEITALYTITNTGSEAITIGEVGLISNLHAYNSNHYSYKCLIERTVLDSPVTIPAGGVGQVTYTIRMNYPTA